MLPRKQVFPWKWTVSRLGSTARRGSPEGDDDCAWKYHHDGQSKTTRLLGEPSPDGTCLRCQKPLSCKQIRFCSTKCSRAFNRQRRSAEVQQVPVVPTDDLPSTAVVDVQVRPVVVEDRLEVAARLLGDVARAAVVDRAELTLDGWRLSAVRVVSES